LDRDGKYKSQQQSSVATPSFLGRLTSIFTAKKKGTTETIGDLILSELETTEKLVQSERERFVKADIPEKEKGRRIMYLFQKDLMPGINGMILESKEKRDEVKLRGCSRTAKIVAWLFLGVTHVSMLFYILLFALSQDSHRQGAWGKSFALWFVMEVFLVSSLSVFVMNVLIPSLVMRDVGHIKKKLVSTVLTFYKEMAKEKLENRGEQKLLEEEEKNNGENKKRTFNSAEYLFVSTRLAHMYPDLKLAKMVMSFQTPWPKQSYQHVTDVSKTYDRKFSTITRSLSIVILFFLSSLLSVPISVQDMLIQMTSTVALGYTILFHVQLYQIFPVLIIIPTIFLAAIVHFIVKSNRAKKQIEQARLLKDVGLVGTQQTTSLGESLPVVASTEQQSPRNQEVVHKRRRASLQAGLNLAERLQRELKDDGEASSDSDDESSSIVSSFDDLSCGSTNSSKAQKKFQYISRQFKEQVPEGSDDSVIDQDANDDDLLFNLHLAVQRSAPRSILPTIRGPNPADINKDDQDDDDNSLLFDDDQDEDYEDDQDSSLHLVSVSNSSIASKLLSLPDQRRRPYEKPSQSTNDMNHLQALSEGSAREEKEFVEEDEILLYAARSPPVHPARKAFVSSQSRNAPSSISEASSFVLPVPSRRSPLPPSSSLTPAGLAAYQKANEGKTIDGPPIDEELGSDLDDFDLDLED
jgi:uncharacterized membrane protein